MNLEFIISIGIMFSDLTSFSNTNTSQMRLQLPPAVSTTAIASYAIPELIHIALLSLIILPLSVGIYKCFLNFSSDKMHLSDVFYAFKNRNYLHIIGSMAWMGLFQFLWSLLLIIPGVVKALAYCMTPYILADNPKIGCRRALKLSIAMTKGQKGKIFVLYLSFIGWYLLGLIPCGIGVFFLMPYFTATFTELYIKLRQNAFANGLCTPEELYAEP